MSYDVAICLSDVPADDEAAWERVNALADSAESDGSPSAEFQSLHAELTARFPCISDLPDDDVDDEVWSVGPLIDCFGQRIAVLSMVFSAVEDVMPFLIVTANSHGMTVFDWQTQTIHRPGDIVFMVEDEDSLRNPTAKQLEAAIERLTPNGGPGFAVLESTPDYVQTAGGDGVYTVEWRQYTGEVFQHYVAGKQGDSKAETQIPTNGFQVAVKKNECLNSADVIRLFTAFLAGEDRPADFTWRDTTEQFQ